jgi:hypothetical protein
MPAMFVTVAATYKQSLISVVDSGQFGLSGRLFS